MVSTSHLKSISNNNSVFTKDIEWGEQVQICCKHATSQKEFRPIEEVNFINHYFIFGNMIYEVLKVCTKEISEDYVEFIFREEERLGNCSFEEFVYWIHEFKDKYPDGRYFSVQSSSSYIHGEECNVFKLSCESPKTKEDIDMRAAEETIRKENRYKNYLELKKEFEGV